MKKIFLIIIFLSAFCCIDLMAETEYRFSIGGAFAATWQKIGDDKAAIYAGGFNANYFSFYGDFPIALYANASVAFSKKYISAGRTIDLDTGFVLNETIGPGLSIPLNDKLRIIVGFGFHLSEIILFAIPNTKKLTEYGLPSDWGHMGFSIGYGIGGTIGVNVKLTDSVFFDFGSSFAYDFNYNTSFSNFFSALSANSDRASAFTFVPYIGIGFSWGPREPLFQF